MSGWSHTLNKISVNAKSDDTELTSEFRTKFNTNPSVTVPKNPTTVDELKSEIEKIQEQASSSDESPTSSSLYDYTY